MCANACRRSSRVHLSGSLGRGRRRSSAAVGAETVAVRIQPPQSTTWSYEVIIRGFLAGPGPVSVTLADGSDTGTATVTPIVY